MENHEEEVEETIEEEHDEEACKINPLEGYTGKEIHNPVKAIRDHCSECSTGAVSEIRNCVVKSCSLYPFRLGKNPYRSQNLSEEARQARVERGRAMAAARPKKVVVEAPVKKLRV